ncbi:MAG: hypothetical protein KME54_19925 [Tolypothrix brevis GSE-NOS-MK-07-07A]|nr:hypothetical protein [Tolypothrix brevis GSE-NOS-MK-07-07A]
MKIIDHKDAINRRLYNNKSFVETAIYRVSCLNRTVLRDVAVLRLYKERVLYMYFIYLKSAVTTYVMSV